MHIKALGLWFYRQLLYLYPAEFQAEMLEVFRHRLEEKPLILVCWQEVQDLPLGLLNFYEDDKMTKNLTLPTALALFLAIFHGLTNGFLNVGILFAALILFAVLGGLGGTLVATRLVKREERQLLSAGIGALLGGAVGIFILPLMLFAFFA